MDSIMTFFSNSFGSVPRIMFFPQFDLTLKKLYILWELRSQSICPDAVTSLAAFDSIDSDDQLTGWIATCAGLEFDPSFNLEILNDNLYYFIDDSELTFEFITLRRWLRFIGCPMSLIYRISRSFYFNFELSGSVEYQYEIRTFVFNQLRGFVSDRDFFDLEGALFGPQFGFILQRMFAFRGFKANSVPRMDCGRWFNAWGDDYELDITTYTFLTADGGAFNFDTFNIDTSAVIVAIPVFDARVYFTGYQLAFYNYFSLNISGSIAQRFLVALNSLPDTFTTRFEFETYFIRSVIGIDAFLSSGWQFSSIFSSPDFVAIFQTAVGASATPNLLVPSTISAPTAVNQVFTPLQLVLNDWLASITWLTDAQRYEMQCAILFFDNRSVNAPYAFYGYIQRFFFSFGFDAEFRTRFNLEFSSQAWFTTITRYQVVAMCLGAGFPLRIIYGSLNLFFEIDFDTELTIEYVLGTILVGQWFIDISSDVTFGITEYEGIFEWNFDQLQLFMVNYFARFNLPEADFVTIQYTIDRFVTATWDGTFQSIVRTFEISIPDFATSQFRTLLLAPDFDIILVKVRLLWTFQAQAPVVLCDADFNALSEISSLSFFYREITGWKQASTCSYEVAFEIPSEADFDAGFESLYSFLSDDDLTFEFIALRALDSLAVQCH